MRKQSVVWVAFNVFFFIFAVTRFAHCEKVELTASPRVSMAPSAITLRLVITDATEELWCPGIRWYAPDGTIAYESSDCVPYSEAGDDTKRQSWTRRYRVSAGEWTFCVGLEKPEGKTIRKLCETVRVGGS